MEKVVGFYNTGNICWYNSLIQALLSLNSFVLAVKLSDGTEGGKVVCALRELIHSIENTSDRGVVHSHHSLVAMLVDLNKTKNMKLQVGQQSASEGFVKLLECINIGSINTLFTHRYEEKVRCVNTQKTVSSIVSTNNHFMIFDEDELNKRSLVEYIRYHETDISGYKPDTGDANSTYRKHYILRYMPKIIVFLLNRYGTTGKGSKVRSNISIPSEFTVKSSITGMYMLYVKQAEIDHYGGLSGGHYICRASRGKGRTYVFNDSFTGRGRLGTTPNTYMTFYEYTKDVSAP